VRTGRAAGELPWEGGAAPPPAIALQVRRLAHKALLTPLVALVLPAASAEDAAAPPPCGGRSGAQPGGAGRPPCGGPGDAADMDVEASPSSAGDSRSASAGLGGFFRWGVLNGHAPRAAGGAAGGAGRGPGGAAGEGPADPRAGARALCALLGALLDDVALQADALHALCAELVARLWFSYMRARAPRSAACV